ncbi:MAG: hypothetical protein NTW61_09715 [Candidatus Melainabacteria bacterium]|nr:hypothetical protein [Candidatus Melainabacteria bacterium]
MPLVLGAIGAVTGITALAVAFFKKPAEGAKVVDEAAQKEIKALQGQITSLSADATKQAETLAQHGGDLWKHQVEIDSKASGIVYDAERNTLKNEIVGVSLRLAGVEAGQQQQAQQLSVLELAQEAINSIFGKAKVDIQAIQEQLAEIDPRIAGGTIRVSEKIKPLFSFGEYNVSTEAQIEFRNSALGQSVSNLHNQAMKYRDDNTQIPTIQSMDIIKKSFEHLRDTNTQGSPVGLYDLKLKIQGSSNPVDPYDKQLRAFVETLEGIEHYYSTGKVDLLKSNAYFSKKELLIEAKKVLTAAQTNEIEKTKTAQANLMTWLEGIFTKTKPEIFEMNTNGKKPLKTLPAPHSDSDWVRDQKLLEGDKPLAELTQTLLGSGFTMAEHPYMMGDVSTLSDAIGALRRALVAEQGYTLENGVLQAPEGSGRNQLARTLNRIAKTLISIDDKAIEGGLVPLRVVEGNVKNLDLPTQLWNARLDGDEDGVKAVTAQMFEELRSALVSSFFAENPLSFPEKENYAGGVLKFVNQSYPSYPRVSTTCYDTITTKGNELSKGLDFTQTLTNQLFDDLEASKMMDNPHVLFSMWELATKCIDTLPTSNTNKQNWDASPFPKVLDYAAWHTHESKARVGRMSEDAQIALANWKDFPELKEKVQAVISARTESVEKVKTAQTALMAFLKDKFYKPEAQAPA